MESRSARSRGSDSTPAASSSSSSRRWSRTSLKTSRIISSPAICTREPSPSRLDAASQCSDEGSGRVRGSLVLLRLVHRDGFDRDLQARIRDAEFRRGPRRRLIWKELLVRLVHRLEVRRVGQEDGGLDHGGHRQPEFFEDRRYVLQRLSRLPRDIGRGPLARFRTGSNRRLRGNEDEAVRDDAVGVRTKGLRVVRQIGDRAHDVRVGNVPTTKRIVPDLVVLRVLYMQEYIKFGRR